MCTRLPFELLAQLTMHDCLPVLCSCPVGLTTNPAAINKALSDCNLYMAGYGTVHGVVQQCPLGTYQAQDTAVGNSTACQTCSDRTSGHKWTPTTGAVAANHTTEGVSCSCRFADTLLASPAYKAPIDESVIVLRCAACF